MQSVKSVVLRQYRFKGIGFIRSMLAYLFFYLAPINFVLLMVTAWYTTISPWASEHAPWLSLWLFILIIVGILAVGLILEFKLILPSHIAFLNIQTYSHSNPIRDDLEKIKKHLGISDIGETDAKEKEVAPARYKD